MVGMSETCHRTFKIRQTSRRVKREVLSHRKEFITVEGGGEEVLLDLAGDGCNESGLLGGGDFFANRGGELALAADLLGGRSLAASIG